MTTACPCSCVICKKLTSNLGIAAHVSMIHEKNLSWTKAGNKARKGKSPWNKGLSIETSDGMKKQTETFRTNFLSGFHKPAFQKHSEETKKQMSISRKKLYESGWEGKSGRCLKFDYNSPIAGNIKVDGTWELKVAKWLDNKKLTWKRNKIRFPYINLQGNKSTYCPDFWIKEWNSYLEVKGHETDLDRCKWQQFPDKLIIWKKKEIYSLEGELGQGARAAC